MPTEICWVPETKRRSVSTNFMARKGKWALRASAIALIIAIESVSELNVKQNSFEQCC